MSFFDVAAVFLCLTAAFAYINKRFIGLPTTIGVMLVSLVISLLLIILSVFGISAPAQFEKALLDQVDFTELLMDGMLSMLLFAGALHVKTADLRQHKKWVGLLAIFGTLLSALIVAALTYWLMPLLGLPLPFIWCLIFGALISPTDPIAVMGILKSAGAPKSVETVIAGESLFNDGIGVVLFALLVGILSSHHIPDSAEVGKLLLHEAGGGQARAFRTQRLHGKCLGAAAGGQRHHTVVQRGRHLDALHHAGPPGGGGIGFDDAGGAQDADAAQDAQPRVGGLLRHLLAAGHAHGDLQPVLCE